MNLKNKIIKLVAVILLFGFTQSYALIYKSSTGIGIILGNPTGLSLKFADNGSSHFNAALGWSLRKDSNLYFHTDYIFKRFNSIRFTPSFSMTPTMGIGGRIITKNDEIGLRIPFGLLYNFRNNPFDFFIELVPTLDIIPATDFDIGFALSFRYLF